VRGLTCATREHLTLQPRSRATHTDSRPAPRDVDVVRERDGELRIAVPRRRHAELAAEPLERRVERVEARRGGEEPPVPVALRTPLLEPRDVEEGCGELVPLRQLAALGLLPGLGPVRDVVAEAEIACSERVENPASAALDAIGDLHDARVYGRRGD
jgi:hypothetical protein